MSVERALDGWEGVQRQGHDFADRIGSLAQGLGCLIQSHLNSSVSLSQSVISSTLPGWTSDDAAYGRFNDEHERSLPWHWPWIVKPQRRPLNRVQFNCKRNLPKDAENGTPEGAFSISQGASELGQRLEQAGADLTACIRGFVHDIAKRFSLPFKGDAELLLVPQSLEHDAKLEFQGDYMPWREVNEASASGDKVRAATWKRLNSNRNSGADESQAQAGHVQSEIQDVSNEELFSYINKWQGRLHRQQGSVNMTTTFSSRTQEIESSVVARGDLWRAEVSHGGNSASGSSPLFLLQVGPILFVRDTTLLLPIHLSKQHLLWYGFDRKNGLHSLCPAVWTKHRRWLLMSMICLNPLTCTFMDLQFPNGQLTYVAGEGLTSCAFIRAFGGLIQAQSRQPGDSKISFSKKMSWGTQITPSLQLPEKSFSLGVVQPLAWHRSGVMVKPRVQLSVTPTIGGRNAGWRAELSHSLREKLSWACGCALTIQPTAYVSVSLGKSLQKGGYSGSTGVIIIAETPVENLRRASVSIQLNNEVEY